MTDQELIEALGRHHYYHIIQLNERVSTPGQAMHVPAQQLCLKYLSGIDLRGKRVLDIGCRDGLFSFAAEKAGAAEVIGVDNDLSAGAVEVLIPYLNSKVVMRESNLYDVTAKEFGLFDVVIFPGVLYHLRYPFLAMRVIRDLLKPGGRLVIETGVYVGDSGNAMLYCPVGEESPYEATSCTFFNEKGLRDSLASLGFGEFQGEHLTCRPDESAVRTFRSRVRGVLELLAPAWLPPRPSPPLMVDRYVLACTYEGFEVETNLGQYWEGTHQYHSEIDGARSREESNRILSS